MNPTPSSSLPYITAAVVNYNGRKFLEHSLGSLAAQENARVEIILVDNASTDDSLEFVRARFAQARILANARNAGYSAALNQAVDVMQGDYFLAMNTDIALKPRFLEHLAACIARRRAEGCGYAQGKVRYMTEDGRRTNGIYSTGHLFGLNRLVYNRGQGHPDRAQFEREERIPGGNAASLLMSREMLDDMRAGVGVFDPLFFMYGGDVDFDWLAARRGWACWYCPEAVAFHIGEASSRITSRGFDAAFVNARFLAMIKNDRLGDVLRDLPRIARANARDLISKVRRNPPLLWQIPIDLARHVPAALRSRRATRRLRVPRPGGVAMPARRWMLWSVELLRKPV